LQQHLTFTSDFMKIVEFWILREEHLACWDTGIRGLLAAESHGNRPQGNQELLVVTKLEDPQVSLG